jgi:hypothetical protein
LAWSHLDAGECVVDRALLSFYLYYGDNFKIECPTASGKMMNLFEVAHEIANRRRNVGEALWEFVTREM